MERAEQKELKNFLAACRDAAEYARAALRNFETYGQAAAAEIQNTQQLLEEIEQERAKQ